MLMNFNTKSNQNQSIQINDLLILPLDKIEDLLLEFLSGLILIIQ